MITLDCLVASCKEQVMHTDEDVVIALFNAHTSTHTADVGRNRGSDRSKRNKLAMLKISQGMSVDSWKSFQDLWRLCKDDADLSEVEGGLQPMQCCDKELRIQILHEDPEVMAKPEIEQFRSIRKLAVIPARMLNRPQEDGELPWKPRVKGRGKAATCELARKCYREERKSNKFANNVRANVLSEAETPRDVLGWNFLDENTLAEDAIFVEHKGMAREAYEGEAEIVKTGYGAQQETVNTTDEAKLRQKI